MLLQELCLTKTKRETCNKMRKKWKRIVKRIEVQLGLSFHQLQLFATCKALPFHHSSTIILIIRKTNKHTTNQETNKTLKIFLSLENHPCNPFFLYLYKQTLVSSIFLPLANHFQLGVADTAFLKKMNIFIQWIIWLFFEWIHSLNEFVVVLLNE